MSDRKPVFSQRMNDALIKTAMIDEMVRVDHWQGIDECLAVKPKVLDKYADYADAALKAIRRVEGNPTPIVPSKLN